MSDENGISPTEKSTKVFRYCEESEECRDIIQDASVPTKSLVDIVNKLIDDKASLIGNDIRVKQLRDELRQARENIEHYRKELEDECRSREAIVEQRDYYYRLSEDRLQDLQLSRLESGRLNKKNRELLKTIEGLKGAKGI